MITSDYCRTMARYNAWQNEQQIAAAGALSDAERRLDRGAFFGSIFGTCNHLLWGDRAWLARFTDLPAPEIALANSPQLTPDWQSFTAARRETDQAILDWTAAMIEADTVGTLRYYSSAFGTELAPPVSLCLMHFFNHQTHHRGQIHAMLSAAGAPPVITDLPGLPEITQSS